MMDAYFDFVRRIVPRTETAFLVPAVAPTWYYTGSAIDLDFVNDRYHSATAGDIAIGDVLSISRASDGYATTSAGLLTLFGSNTFRRTDLGLLAERSQQNVCLWCRDLTNGAWSATNITAALDQTGVDGTANAASSIIATSANGTILQAITLASSVRIQSAYVKRLIGSGTINMTTDNGATWTAVTVTSGWTRVSIPAQTLANPTVGFQIVTSGDKIAVDFVQNEEAPFESRPSVTSPILTTTTAVTRARDLIGVINELSTEMLDATCSILVDVKYLGLVGTAIFGKDTKTEGALTGDALLGSQLVSTQDPSGTALNATWTGTTTWTTGVKVAICHDSINRSLVGNGGSVASDANGGAFTSPLTLDANAGGYDPGYLLFRRLTVWSNKLSDAALQALTVP